MDWLRPTAIFFCTCLQVYTGSQGPCHHQAQVRGHCLGLEVSSKSHSQSMMEPRLRFRAALARLLGLCISLAGYSHQPVEVFGVWLQQVSICMETYPDHRSHRPSRAGGGAGVLHPALPSSMAQEEEEAGGPGASDTYQGW